MNFTLKLFGLLFSCILVQSVIVGQESFNLEQAIKYSQEHSTRLKIQKLDVQNLELMIGEASVEFDANKVSEEKIKQAIVEAGYIVVS